MPFFETKKINWLTYTFLSPALKRDVKSVKLNNEAGRNLFRPSQIMLYVQCVRECGLNKLGHGEFVSYRVKSKNNIEHLLKFQCVLINVKS